MNIEIRLWRTPALWDQIESKTPHRDLQLAVLKVDLTKVSPDFAVGINLPSPGIIRDGLDAYVWDAMGQKVTGAAAMRREQGLVRAEDLIRVLARQRHLQPIAWTGSGNTVQNLGCVAFRGEDAALISSI